MMAGREKQNADMHEVALSPLPQVIRLARETQQSRVLATARCTLSHTTLILRVVATHLGGDRNSGCHFGLRFVLETNLEPKW